MSETKSNFLLDPLEEEFMSTLSPMSKTTTKHSILLVDDDPGQIKLMGRILATLGEVRVATSGKDALRLVREAAPDLMLLDAEMPGMSGFEVLETMKADRILAAVPVIFVTSHNEPAFEVAGLEMGAVDFIGKPVNAPLVLARCKNQLRVKRLSDELRRVSSTDVLTGVANRRAFEEAIEREWLRARRGPEPISLLLVDIDHFKLYNDRYGHPTGDTCLRSVAQALVVACLRPADMVARFGGEEFAVLLPQTGHAGAEHIAARILDAAEALDVEHATSPTSRHVTVSVGVSCYDDASTCWLATSSESRYPVDPRAREHFAALVRAADRALYSAKDAGRAQARFLDIADADTPSLAREISPHHRSRPVFMPA